MNNRLKIEITVLSKVLDRSITAMNKKHCNMLDSSKIMPTQINMFNM
jgi:hypothetical protein